MDVLIAADEPLLALSLEATLDLGGHKVVGPAATAAAALTLAEADRPGLAFVHLGLRNGGHLARALHEWLGVPSFLLGLDQGAMRLPHGPPGGGDRPGTSARPTAAGSAAAADRTLRPSGAVEAERLERGQAHPRQTILSGGPG